VSWHRTEQVAGKAKPAPLPRAWRQFCGCGCGVWFYAPRKPGRKPLYINAEHAYRARYQRRKSWA
jgi:hypothetical protein